MDGKKGIIHLFGGSLFGKTVTFIFNILVSRCLGPTSLGIFSLILTSAQTFDILSRLGIDFGLQFNLTKPEAKEKKLFNQTALSALYSVDVVSICLSIFLLIWLTVGDTFFTNEARVNKDLIIFCTILICLNESLAGISWEIFLLSGRTKLFALRSALYHPLKLFFALIGALLGGLNFAIAGYASIGFIQLIGIRKYANYLLEARENKAQVSLSKQLIKQGLPFFATNAVNSAIFLPLLAEVATSSGFKEVGFLRIGQLFVQFFTLLPGALAPILFIKLRLTKSSSEEAKSLGLSLDSIWCIGLITLSLYLLLDQYAISLFFGQQFIPAIVPTRALILAAILESLSQIMFSNVLAQNRMKFYSTTQIISSAIAAALGILLIPILGIRGFILAKLFHAITPAAIYLLDAFPTLPRKKQALGFSICTLSLLPLCVVDNINTILAYIVLTIVLLFTSREAFLLRKDF